MFTNRFRSSLLTGLIGMLIVTAPAQAQKVNCSNEFRSGKLYFDQAKGAQDDTQREELYAKSLGKFEVAVEHCPDKWEYRARYALILSEMAKVALSKIPLSTSEEAAAHEQAALDFYKKAGSEFDAALETKDGTKKKAIKFVKNNRGHYWVHNYNEGLELLEEEDAAGAAVRFEIARFLDNKDVRSVNQGAVALIQAGQRDKALQWVEEGLAIDPEDEGLIDKKTKIFRDMAISNANEASEEESQEKLMKAVELYDSLIEDDPEDPNLLFERGLSKLTGASFVGKADEAKGQVLYAEAAEDFLASAELVDPAGSNAEFHHNCLFNAVQAYNGAGENAKMMNVLEKYTCANPMDAAAWQFKAGALIDGDDQTGAVAALMISKSLRGTELPVDSAVATAEGEAKASVSNLGKPDKIFSYQEASSGNQIQTWFWSEKNIARCFILGDQQGEMTWCGEAAAASSQD